MNDRQRDSSVLGSWIPAVLLLGAVLALGCGNTDRDPRDTSAQGATAGLPPSAVGGRSSDGGSTGLGGKDGTGEGGAVEPPPVDCTTPEAPEAPLRRLTRAEYNNTVRDLLGDASRPADALPFEPGVGVPEALSLSSATVDGYHTLAHDFALAATRDAGSTQALTGCDAEQDGDAACAAQFIRDILPKAFRRPAEAEDLSAFEAVFAKGKELGGDYASGVRAVLEVLLQSPEFLYRVELGEPADEEHAGWDRPRQHELASRLSYLFWSSMPDAELFTAAERGELTSKQQVADQARRLLASDRAHEPVSEFYFQLLGVDRAAKLSPEVAAFTPEIRDAMREETIRFVREVTWEGPGDLQALLTAPFTWVNGPLAAFYGIPGVRGSAFQRVNLEGMDRGGLLTQGLALTASSSSEQSAPVRRGVRVLRQLFCMDIPLPPPDSPFMPPLSTPFRTTRQAIESYGRDPACAGCHHLIDPVGFAFEHYDGVGRFRDMENGEPIDASGKLTGTDVDGEFYGAVELADRLAHSDEVASCFVDQWASFAYGGESPENDLCSRQQLKAAFESGNRNVVELLIALTQTDAFLYRARP